MQINELRREKTRLRDFRPGPTQTGLYDHRRWLEAYNFGLSKKSNCTICVAKTMALISCAVANPRLFSHMQKAGVLMMPLNNANLSRLVSEPLHGTAGAVLKTEVKRSMLYAPDIPGRNSNVWHLTDSRLNHGFYQDNMSVRFISPHTPLLYRKLGFTGAYTIFLFLL